MGKTFHKVTPVECTPGTALSYQDVDLDTYIAGLGDDVTGVILHVVISINTGHYYRLRKNGSTDDRNAGGEYGNHCWAMVGVDGDHIFECYVDDTTEVDIYIVGYTTTGVSFFTNGVDKSLAVADAWTDIDCAAEAPGATGLIFEIFGTAASGYEMGFRMNGSSDNRIGYTVGHDTFSTIIGCDGAQICEGYIGDTAFIDFYLIGYVTFGAKFNLNAPDLSLGSTAEWLDLSPLSDGATMGFIEIASTLNYQYGLRENGSAEDIYSKAMRHPWAFVGCDAGRIMEGEIANLGVDFFEVGVALESLARGASIIIS